MVLGGGVSFYVDAGPGARLEQEAAEKVVLGWGAVFNERGTPVKVGRGLEQAAVEKVFQPLRLHKRSQLTVIFTKQFSI